MPLLTDEIREKMPALYATDGQKDAAVALVKYFTPNSFWTWYAIEAAAVIAVAGSELHVSLADALRLYDLREIGERKGAAKLLDVRFYGLVDGQYTELGYFSLAELSSQTGPHGVAIERDEYFEPTAVGKLMDDIRAAWMVAVRDNW